MTLHRPLPTAGRLLGLVAIVSVVALACSDDSTASTPAETSEGQGEPAAAETNALDVAGADELAEGSGLEFEVLELQLTEHSDEYSASVVAPIGWEIDSFIETTLDPPPDSGVGIFAEMSFRAGCSGSCEPTDWEERLREPDGSVESLSELDDYDERPTSEGNGLVVTGIGSLSRPRAVVFYWDDSADHFFKCSVELGRRDAHLREAFVAACESSRPHWFEV